MLFAMGVVTRDIITEIAPRTEGTIRKTNPASNRSRRHKTENVDKSHLLVLENACNS